MSVICSILFIRRVDVPKLVEALQQANYWWLMPVAFINVFSLYFRSLRWRWLLLHLKPTRTWSLYIANMVGFMANNVLPARLGELVRVYVVSRKEEVRLSACLATLVIERVYDLGSILVMFAMVVVAHSLGIGIRVGEDMPAWVNAGAALSLAGGLVILMGMAGLKAAPDLVGTLTSKLMWLLPREFTERVVGFQRGFIDAISFLDNFQVLAMSLIHSVIMWGAFVYSVYCLFYAFGIDDFTVFHAMFLLVALAFGIAIPAGPGYVGTYHWACQLALGFMFADSISSGTVGALAVVMHLVGFITVTTLGIVYMLLEGMSLSEFQRRPRGGLLLSAEGGQWRRRT